MWYARGMVVWSIVSQIFLLLQAIQIFEVKSSAGQSTPAYWLLEVSNIIWIVYGTAVLTHKNMPIIASSVVSFVLGALVLVAIYLYP